jgi:hypothetical protein
MITLCPACDSQEIEAMYVINGACKCRCRECDHHWWDDGIEPDDN